MKNTTEWSESAKDKSNRVDAMLRHLMRIKAQEYLREERVPDRMTYDEIAEFCGVDRMVIYRTEMEAIRKIRSKFAKCDLK
jgi:DNA-directed RNA polymerase specialized sigma subunit